MSTETPSDNETGGSPLVRQVRPLVERLRTGVYGTDRIALCAEAADEIDRLLAALRAAYAPVPYYISGPYPTDGGWAMCELATGRIVHRVPGA